MELGQKLKEARVEAGLSQRQLCGDVITRNMLSQIEHGTARPSMQTLQYLAARLGKTVGFFLGEETVSDNQTLMAQARSAYGRGDLAEVRAVLTLFRQPDTTFDLEYRFLYASALLAAAEEAAEGGKDRYARDLLDQAGTLTEGFAGLERRRLLLLGKFTRDGVGELCARLPDLDEELFLRARAALEGGDTRRGLALLDAMEDRESGQWQLLRGRLLLEAGDYAGATQHLLLAEEDFPETVPLLERCFRELGDYQQAYLYACKGRAG